MYKGFPISFSTVSFSTVSINLLPPNRECQNHSPIVKSAPIAVYIASFVNLPDLSIFTSVTFFMNLPAGSILATSPPTGNPLPSGTVDSSTSPRLAFYLYRSLCRRVPEREAAKSVYVVPACSCLASVRDRHVYWCCRRWKLGSGSDYRRPCAGDINYAFAAAYVAALEAAAVYPSRRVS